MSAKQRSLGERHPICQERPAQSLAAGWAPVPLLPASPSLPQLPTSSPSWPGFGLPPLALASLPTFVSTGRPGWVCQAGTERLDAAGPGFRCARLSLTRDLARGGTAIRSVSASRPPLVPERDTLRTLVAALCFPASLPRPSTSGGGRAELAFFSSNRGGLCVLSIPASAEPGLHRPPRPHGIFFPLPLCFLPHRRLREVGVGNPDTKSHLH